MPACIQYVTSVFSTPGCIQYARVYSVRQGVFSMPGLFSTPGLVRQAVFSIHGIECIQYVWVCSCVLLSGCVAVWLLSGCVAVCCCLGV